MTDKDLRRRYPDIPSLVRDLEETLAIEAARTGHSTGEATAVLRTLPPSARRRLPFRLRHSIPILAVIALIAGGLAAAALLVEEGVDRTQRGTGGTQIEPEQGERVISLAATSAEDYDPQGDDEEHQEETPLVTDRVPATAWSTETYRSGLAGANKEGVGVVLDANPGVEAVRLEVQTLAPGWALEVYAASGDAPPEDLEGDWTRIGGGTIDSEEQRLQLDTEGERYRWYLAWITELPESGSVEIAELSLFERTTERRR